MDGFALGGGVQSAEDGCREQRCPESKGSHTFVMGFVCRLVPSVGEDVQFAKVFRIKNRSMGTIASHTLEAPTLLGIGSEHALHT